MQQWSDLADVPAGYGPTALTIGNFDGVHLGHQAVLRRLVSGARAANLKAVAITFDPHPRQVHEPETAPELLTGITDRLELLAETGIDAVLVLPYTLEFAQQTPSQFVGSYFQPLGAQLVVVGRDIHFGRDNSGDLETMIELGGTFGFEVDVIPGVTGAGEQRRWSSTWARQLLQSGDVGAAAAILGRPHRVRGVVVHGNKRGRQLGFPTANLSQTATGLVPADGVYAGWLTRVSRAGKRLPAAISVGTNPTFDGVQRRVEAHVLDRTDLDLYDEEVLVEFVDHLRPTVRFDDVDSLVVQMGQDIDQTRVRLGL